MGDSLSYPSSQNSNTIKLAHLIIIAWNSSKVCSFRFAVSVSSKLQSKLSAKAILGTGGADRGKWLLRGGRDVT